MKKSILSLLVLFGLFFSSCVREEPPYIPPVTNAAVEYNWESDFDTYVDGYIYNDGETYLRGVDLEFRTYDAAGFIIDYEYEYFFTDFYPGESVYFSTWLPVSYASDVRVFVSGLD